MVGRLPQHRTRSGQVVAGNHGNCNAHGDHDSLDQEMVLQLTVKWTVSVLCCALQHHLNTTAYAISFLGCVVVSRLPPAVSAVAAMFGSSQSPLVQRYFQAVNLLLYSCCQRCTCTWLYSFQEHERQCQSLLWTVQMCVTRWQAFPATKLS